MNKDEEKIIVKLDAKQHSWLLQRVSYEFDEELRYQSRNDFVDTEYLDMILSIYKELLYAIDRHAYERIVSEEIIAKMQKEIDEIVKENSRGL